MSEKFLTEPVPLIGRAYLTLKYRRYRDRRYFHHQVDHDYRQLSYLANVWYFVS